MKLKILIVLEDVGFFSSFYFIQCKYENYLKNVAFPGLFNNIVSKYSAEAWGK